MSKHLSRLTYTLAALLAFPMISSAASEPTDNRIRAGVNDSGVGIAWEHKFNKAVGIEVSVFTTHVDSYDWGDWDFNRIFSDTDYEARMTPLTVSALFHLTPKRPVDLYLGPGVAFLSYSDESHEGIFEDEAAGMFQIGFDVLPKGSNWGFNLDLKHIFEADNGDSPFADRATLRAGIVVRF